MHFKLSQIVAKALRSPLTNSLAERLSYNSSVLPVQINGFAGASMPGMHAHRWMQSYPASALEHARCAFGCRSPFQHAAGSSERPDHHRLYSIPKQHAASNLCADRPVHDVQHRSQMQLGTYPRVPTAHPHKHHHSWHARHRHFSTSAAAGAAAPSGDDQPADGAQQNPGQEGILRPVGKFVMDQFLPLGLLASMALG